MMEVGRRKWKRQTLEATETEKGLQPVWMLAQTVVGVMELRRRRTKGQIMNSTGIEKGLNPEWTPGWTVVSVRWVDQW